MFLCPGMVARSQWGRLYQWTRRTRLPVGYPKNSEAFQVCAKKEKVPSLKLTAIVRELIVGRQSFPVGMPSFPERTVSFREGTPIILFWRCVV